MSSLVVGSVVIPVAVSSPNWNRLDAVDRARMFDNSYFASTAGGAANEWQFSTPPVTLALAATYKAALGIVAPQLCSGDILELPTMCCAEYQGGTPVRTAVGHRVVLSFALHEVQPAKLLLKYAPGDTITGEAFTRSTTAFYRTTAGVLTSAAINVKRDNHFTTIAGTRSLFLEDTRTNGLLRSQEFDNASWTKSDATISANATTAPDGTATADKLVEAATTAAHQAYQGTTTTASTLQPQFFFVKAGERTWCYVQTNLRDGTIPRTWVNLSTGAIGTTGAGHTVRVTALGSGWYQIEVVVNSGAGAGATFSVIGAATADNVFSYLGDITKGIYIWGADHEQDKPFASSYVATTTGALARGADLYSMPFAIPPGELSIYVKFIERGSGQTANAQVVSIASSAAATPHLLLFNAGANYRAYHDSGTGSAVTSDAGALPVAGDTCELLLRLYGDGSVGIEQSINGGVASVGIQSAAKAFATAWSGQLVWLNGTTTGSVRGFIAIQSFKIVAGARSLDLMRVL